MLCWILIYWYVINIIRKIYNKKCYKFAYIGLKKNISPKTQEKKNPLSKKMKQKSTKGNIIVVE